jgi:hypothetical protein
MKLSFPERNYNDTQALDEFIVINWAYVTEDLGEADVWHQGTKSFYRAQLLKKLTPEDIDVLL